MERMILALDVPCRKNVEQLLDQIGVVSFVKVGMELFYGEGREIVFLLKERGVSLFLDLKLHDIPQTVARAVSQLATLKVEMLTLHATGGMEMMRAAKRAILESGLSTVPKLLAVTQLTSLSQEILDQELKLSKNLESYVEELALLSLEAQMDGVICSPLEALRLRKRVPSSFLLVTPGVRLSPVGGGHHDQKRVASPKEAFSFGADYIVIGREVTRAKNPREEWLKIGQSLL